MSDTKTNLTSLEQRLSLLVSMRTESRNHKACQRAIEVLAEECQSLGLFVSKYEGQNPSLVATTRKTKSPKIMLVAHLDVVPPSHEKHFELKPTITKLRGRGVYDMKFAAACFLEFVHEYSDKLNQYDIGIMFTTDEEIGSDEGASRLLSEEGWRADVAYVPDSSSGMRLEAKAKGVLQANFRAIGRNAHGSRPWDGDNALTRLMEFLTQLQKQYPNKDKAAATLSVNYTRGGIAFNQVPDEAEASIDVRSYSKAELAQISSSIKAQAKKAGIRYKVIMQDNPYGLDKNSPYVKQFWQSFDKVTGYKRSYVDAYGTTDARWFTEYGIPSIIISPKGGDFHGPDEWVSRSDLAVFYNLTVDYINRVHGFNGNRPAPLPSKRTLLRRLMQRVTTG